MEQYYNTSAHNIDLQQLYDYCEQHGEVVCYEKGEQLEQEGELPKWFAFVQQGCFEYVVRSLKSRRKHIAWFSFEGEVAGDFPNLLYGCPSQFTIEAMIPSTVLRIKREQLSQFFSQDTETMKFHGFMSDHILTQFQARYLDFYRATPRERYELLLRRCPGIVNDLPLNAIASFPNISPCHLSNIRKEITFSNEK